MKSDGPDTRETHQPHLRQHKRHWNTDQRYFCTTCCRLLQSWITKTHRNCWKAQTEVEIHHYKEFLSIEFSWTRQFRQYQHVLSCFSQYRSRFHHRCLLVFCKALRLASDFFTSYERFSWCPLNSSSSGSTKKIPRNLLALSSSGFSTAHFCFALLVAASDSASTYLATHCRVLRLFLPSYVSSSTMYIHQVAFRSIKWILWTLSMHRIILFLHPCSSNHLFVFSNQTSSNVCVVLVTSMYFSGIGNDSSFGMYSFTRGSTWWRWMKSPVIDQNSCLASASSRVESFWCGDGEESPPDSPGRISCSPPLSGQSLIKVDGLRRWSPPKSFDCSICDWENKIVTFHRR